VLVISYLNSLAIIVPSHLCRERQGELDRRQLYGWGVRDPGECRYVHAVDGKPLHLSAIDLGDDPFLAVWVTLDSYHLAACGAADRVDGAVEVDLPAAGDFPPQADGRQIGVDPLVVEQRPFPLQAVQTPWPQQFGMGTQRRPTSTIAYAGV
jgi:hypothetical protein